MELTETWKWEKFIPSLGPNREHRTPFYFLLKSGMSKLEYQGFVERLSAYQKATPEAPTRPTPLIAGASDEEQAAHASAEVAWKSASDQWIEKEKAERPGRLAAMFEGVVKFGDEPLRVNGRPITTLTEYFDLTEQTHHAVGLWMELLEALRFLNSVEGTRQLFSERLSGGMDFTRTPSAERAIH